MYDADTILTLKEQRAPDPETNEEFPYNRVRVVGESPVQHTTRGDWTGADARGVIIVPLNNFGSTLDEPFGKLRDLYTVESIPERYVEIANPVRVVNATSAAAGPTPEEVFATEAPGTAPEEGQVRARTRPLGDDGGPAEADGPLGNPRKKRAA